MQENSPEKIKSSKAKHEPLENGKSEERFKQKKSFKAKQFKEGKWDYNQEEIYLKFIKENENLFLNEFSRRSNKVFDQLAQLLNYTRSPEQCRSHHKKLLKLGKDRSFDDIIAQASQRNKKRLEKMRISQKISQGQKVSILKGNLSKYEIKMISNSQKKSPLQIRIILESNFVKW